MAGTKIGGLRAAKTNKEKYGPEFYKKIGSKGGKLGHTGGFHTDDRSFIEKVMRKPRHHASYWGRIGGTISKRGASK